jgi:hypothetical protein
MALYLFLQAPLALYLLWTRVSIFTGKSIEEMVANTWNLPYIPSVVYLLTISLNSTLNPIVYYLRLHDFRNYVQSVVGLFQDFRADAPAENNEEQIGSYGRPAVGRGTINAAGCQQLNDFSNSINGRLISEGEPLVYYETNI